MCDTETIFNGPLVRVAFGEVEDCVQIRCVRPGKSADAGNRGKKR